MQYDINISGGSHEQQGRISLDRLAASETVEQQISRQQREGKKANPLPELVGKWPGEETDEEFEAMLKLLRS